MRILLWNIQSGGGERVDRISAEILNSKADIIALTEFKDNKYGEKLQQDISKSYQYKFFNINLKNIKAKYKKKIDLNSVFVASKVPLSNENNIFIANNEERIISFEVSGIVIYLVYFPQGKLQIPLFEYLFNEIDEKNDKPILILGDFNSGNNMFDRQNKNSVKFHCAKFFDNFEKRDYINIWKELNSYGNEIINNEYSWFSNRNNGFRIDHAFIHKKYISLIKSCYYEHKPRENKVSDHSIMIIDL